MKLRTIQFWAIYNRSTKRIIANAKTKKELVKRWGTLKDAPWCSLVNMKGHYVPRPIRSASTRTTKT